MTADTTADGAAHPPSYARVSLAMMTHSAEANLLGNVHGGEIMKLADSTAGAAATRHSGGPAVTAAMDEMAFLHPEAEIRRAHRLARKQESDNGRSED